MSESRFFFFRTIDRPTERHAINLLNVIGYSVASPRGQETVLLQIDFENVSQVFEVYVDVARKFQKAVEEYHGGGPA